MFINISDLLLPIVSLSYIPMPKMTSIDHNRDLAQFRCRQAQRLAFGKRGAIPGDEDDRRILYTLIPVRLAIPHPHEIDLPTNLCAAGPFCPSEILWTDHQ